MPSRPVLAPTYSTGFPTPVGFAKENLILSHQSQRERVYQRIECVGIIKSHFTAHRSYAKRISIVGDAGHNAGQQRSVAPSVLGWSSEPNRRLFMEATAGHPW